MKNTLLFLLLLMLAPSVALAHEEVVCHPCGCCHRVDYHQSTVRQSCQYDQAKQRELQRRKAAQQRRLRENRRVYRWTWRWPR